MKNALTTLTSSLDDLVNYFIPPKIALDRETRNRAHVFLISHILGPIIGSVVPAALYFVDPHPGMATAVLAVSIMAFWVFPFLLKAGVPYNFLALVSIQNLIFCILWSCYFYGGVTSPTLPWVLVIPLLAFFYLGSSAKLRLIVMTMFAFNLIVFSIFYSRGYYIKDDLPHGAMQLLGLVSTIAASLYVAMMALYYAKALASQTELEAKMRQHLATAKELRAATEDAERAGKAKAEFLARMSHELRTPLNAVIGYSQLLLEDATEEGDTESVADLNKIHNSGQHLLKLVNEILDLSKIEAGKMELHIEETDLVGLLNAIVDNGKPAAEKNGNSISSHFDTTIGNVACDANKLRTVVAELLDNANKFTENGKVRLVASRKASPDGDRLLIEVIDTGIGICQEKLGGLFEKFTVVDDTSTSKYGGTGLGLALSQKLCRLMGGEITVESSLNSGSRFTVDLPLVAPFAGAPLAPTLDTIEHTFPPNLAEAYA